MTPKSGRLAFALFLAAAGIFFALTGPFDMLYGGPFGRYVRQPAFWQGGIELIVLAALIGAALYFLQRWYRVLAVLLLCELYARRQGIDLAILISLFYYEGIAALGTLILNRLGRMELGVTERCLFGILLGTLTWCCAEWILSAFGPGSMRDLQIAAIVVAGTSLLLVRRLPVSSCVFSHVGIRSIPGALLGTFVCTIVLMLFAKASVSIDYDSLWYGMRGDRVLVAAGSAFKGLGLVSPVHYGPQAYELLLVPLMGLRSVTAILGFSTWCWLSLGICLYAITERLGWAPKVRLFAVALAAATPAAMNIAITAKGDAMAATWVFFGAYAIVAYGSSRHRPWLVVAFFAALAATVFRMSVLPYAGLTGLFALCAFAISFLTKQGNVGRGGRSSPRGVWLWLASASVILFVLVTLRTILLAGIPFTEVSTLVNLSERLGLSTSFPVGGPAPAYAGFNTHFIPIILDFLFRPVNLPHVIIQWTGAAFAYFLLIGLAFRLERASRLQGVLILGLLAMTFPILLVVVQYATRGGDGNYFIVPVLSMVLLGAGMVGDRFCERGAIGKTLRWLAGLFVVSSVAVSLVTGSWGPGTHGWDLDFSRPAQDYPARASRGIDAAGLRMVDQYLKGMPADTRMVGVIPDDPGETLPGSWLPVRYEALENIAWTRPGYLRSTDAIDAFLLRDDIRYVLLPRTCGRREKSNGLGERTAKALANLQSRGSATPVVFAPRFVLWRLEK